MRASNIPFFKRFFNKLLRNESGNVLILVAIGMPMLIGGGGLGVDFTQWYLWKRELQYAVDQAAIAGAWAQSDDTTKGTYQDRAKQEYTANLSITKAFASVPDIHLDPWAGGANNSVTVAASATKKLPFSSFFTGGATQISVHAQATWDKGKTFTSCLIATDDDADGAITIGGSSIITAGCGLAALSDSANAITVNGSPTVDAGWIIAKGGIDDWFNTHTDDTIIENMSGLYDPFKDLTPPNPAESQVARTYTCVKGTTTTRANKTTDITSTYDYYKGNSPDTNKDGALSQAELDAATWTLQVNSKGKPKESSSTNSGWVIVENNTVDGITTTTTRTVIQTNNSTGSSATWEVKTTVTKTTQSGTQVTTTPDQANTYPGTYSSIKVGCQTVFATGVYIIDGGGLEIDGNYTVTGSAVMFVLKNGAYIKINGGTNINLTAMQASDLTARGVAVGDANKLAGMLVFEDRSSGGTSKNNINGNASTVLNGTIYLPKSNIDFSGTAKVTSQCLMVAAATINITGNANMSTFCPAGSSEDTTVANVVSKVRLVA